MAGLDHQDGYTGPATLTVGGAEFGVLVELRGYFQPIDGRYHWYGRAGRHDGLFSALGAGRVSGVITTAEGSAPCELSDPDPWGRYRVTGTSTPPFTVSSQVPAEEEPAGQEAAADTGPAESRGAWWPGRRPGSGTTH